MSDAVTSKFSKEAEPEVIQSLQRGALNGAVLRPLGFSYSGIEQTQSGFQLTGKPETALRFSDLSAPVKAEKILGFNTIVLPTKRGKDIKVAGLKAADALKFVGIANDWLSAYTQVHFRAAEQELLTLAEAIARLQQPRRYPAACLLTPFIERAFAALQSLPHTAPPGALSPAQSQLLETVVTFAQSPGTTRDSAIQAFLETELSEMRPFFDKIESKPLSPEQRLAVVTDEDATLVLAGAGSGKTSVIVSKAAYLIARGIRAPEQILLMAFGNDAAAEMAARISERSGAHVDALTFHALGNKIIRAAEGVSPPLADHATDDAKYRFLLRDILIKDIAENDALRGVLLKWFSEFFLPYKNEWDFETLDEYFQWVEANELRTLNGDHVRSFEEWEISNWLYLNGIEFEYEPLYEHELPADARGAYKPDFRLKDSGIYIEHFGVRKSRRPDGSIILSTAPYIDRERYLADMEWKRHLHAEKGTLLIETFSYEKVEGRLLEALAEKLAPYVDVKPRPEDQVFETLAEMGQVDAFTQTLGTFLRHYKSSGATMDQCRARSEAAKETRRDLAFLQIFEPVFEAYQKRLGEQIDFEDMINRATRHIEAGRYESPYHHLLVDEFQDISEGRARLLKALKAQHADARIFAVGDDWQSIFRFAGSDIHLMRNFGKEFGGKLGDLQDVHSVVDLGRTFRSVDKVALPARRFVLKNPAQIEKKVVTATSTDQPAIMVTFCDRAQEAATLKACLESISQQASKTTSVLLLGRYNHLKPDNLRALGAEFPKLFLRFMTVHGSKGLEADHVIILRAAAGRMGFPSEMVDDPVLDLVFPTPETYEHAEERRLFYVALTRARTAVTILANRQKPSAFVRELLTHPEYETTVIGQSASAERKCGACGGRLLQQSGRNNQIFYACEHRDLCGHTLRPCSACGMDLPEASHAHPGMMVCSCGAEFPACPSCNEGWLVEKKGRYGKFLGCIRFPDCKGKRQIAAT
ncbi:MAG: UvrD-helicase domain-containing protein [Gammaproteobacteria bacterium]|nr:UvrD-helicase domain-containing protein [Gammaproteobacteria bacterium]